MGGGIYDVWTTLTCLAPDRCQTPTPLEEAILTTTATQPPQRRIRMTLLALIGLLLIFPACTSTDTNPVPAATEPTGSPGSTSGPAPTATAGVDKVLVIVAENRNAATVVAEMPFLRSQSESYGTATNYYAISHPSLPNYLVMARGSTFGIEDDEDPDAHPLTGPSVFGQLLASGRTAKTYAEAMPRNCALRNDGTYAVRHNPWTYFGDPAERAACQKFDVPSGSPTDGPLADDVAAGELPSIGFVIPDDCNNGHSCSIDTTDRWLLSWLPTIKNGPDFRSGRAQRVPEARRALRLTDQRDPRR